MTTLPPQAAAWLVAEVCRFALPAADPVAHAHPALLREGDHEYLIRYCRHPDDGFRVYTNGRMVPPDLTPEDPTPASTSLEACRFEPAGARLGSVTSVHDQAWIRVRPSEEGCEVHIALRGQCALGHLADRLTEALATGQAVETSSHLIDRGDYQAAHRTIEAALARQASLNSSCDSVHGILLAKLRYNLAILALRDHDLVAARALLSTSLSLAPEFLLARFWMFDTCRRLGDFGGIRRHLRTLEQARVYARLGPSARARIREGRSQLEAARCSDTMAYRAARLLAQHDETAAAHWARGALERETTVAEGHTVLAEVYRRQSRPQQALMEELALLTSDDFDAQVLIRLARRCADRGNPAGGLRLLTRFGNRLAELDTDLVTSTLRTLSEAIDTHLAHRILRDNRDLLHRVPAVERLAQGAAYRGLMLKHAARSGAGITEDPSMEPTIIEQRGGFEAAPGIKPGR